MDLGPPPVDTTIPDFYGAKSPIRRRVQAVQSSSTVTPSFFPLCKFDNSDLEKQGTARGGCCCQCCRFCRRRSCCFCSCCCLIRRRPVPIMRGIIRACHADSRSMMIVSSGVGSMMTAVLDKLEEGETLESVLAAEGASSERVIRAKSRWFLSDGSFTWEPCFGEHCLRSCPSQPFPIAHGSACCSAGVLPGQE